ncbi:MAG: SPOR domain-containing protein [Legionellales bacterium]|nr:SPOR domain-containing protein [Legionellales bacterium]
MPKDYAKYSSSSARARKHGNPRGSARHSHTSATSPFKWLFVGLLLGFCATSGFYFYQHNPRLQQYIQQLLHRTHAEPAPIKVAAVKPPQPTTPPQPKFDFYTLLPKQQVPLTPHYQQSLAEKTATTNTSLPKPTPPATPSPATAPTPQNTSPAPTAVATNNTNTPTKTDTNNRYILQIAAFQSEQDADHLKAQLSLLGFSVRIDPTQNNGKTWYRVWAGPYTSRTLAKSDQDRLSSNQIKSLLREMPA